MTSLNSRWTTSSPFKNSQVGVALNLMLCIAGFSLTHSGFVRADWPEAASQESAWKALPKADVGNGTPLQTWVRILAPTLPHTTAALIELENLYRNEPSSLEDRIRICVARYAVASFHHSEYGKAVALSDLKRVDAGDVAKELETGKTLSDAHLRDVHSFAVQMSKAGRSLTDEQFEGVRSKIGDESMVGLVLQIAHGCFQDRLLLSLGIANIADAPETPVVIHFVESTPNGANTPSAQRDDASELLDSVSHDKQLELLDVTASAWKANSAIEGWSDFSAEKLQNRLDNQRNRTARIAVPEWDSFANKLPPNLYRRPMRIRWSRVVVGYQTKLGPAWIKCLRVFEQEAHQDRVFEESVFWVVTRSLRCFYCMGHCEMLMEVGGLKKPGIAMRTMRLASGDWASFSKQEQVAFQFARKLTEDPTAMTRKDLIPLVDAFGEVRALDLVWWTCRCQFMTKISDAFQLQLETENVFAD